MMAGDDQQIGVRMAVFKIIGDGGVAGVKE
jgi:hypothetical protein